MDEASVVSAVVEILTGQVEKTAARGFDRSCPATSVLKEFEEKHASWEKYVEKLGAFFPFLVNHPKELWCV